jgi:oxygen-independent coproporphyrinogen III oxidase
MRLELSSLRRPQYRDTAAMSFARSAIPEETWLIDAPAQADDEFGIYFHVPFCSHICPYCDFNTYAGQSDRIPAYVEAIQRDAARWGNQFDGRTAASIFFGGGTPSLLAPIQIKAILATCESVFDLAPGGEVTIEANPNDLSEKYCSALLESGVNRLSIGAQTLDRRGLRVLGRRHEADQIASAVAGARRAGFDNVSLDFIYGWPGQTIDQWRSDLSLLLSGEVGGRPPDHLSLYGLIVEPGTPMADAVHRGILAPVDDDTAADFYELAMMMLAEAGWFHYEISNWASSAHTVSRHNAIYWRNGDYAGIGAGAHGHVRNRRMMSQPSPRRYIAALELEESVVTNIEDIDEKTAMGETMMLGLRLLQDGVSAPSFARRHGVSLFDQFAPQLSWLISIGLLDVDERGARLSKRGILLANSVCAEFL